MQQTSINIHVNEIENRIIFKRKTGYYLSLLIPETIKLLGSIKNALLFSPRDRMGVNVKRCLYFAKTVSENISENVSGKCSKKFIDHAKNLQQMHLKLLRKE